MNKSYAYKLNYTLWDMNTNKSRLIKDDTVSFSNPQKHEEILCSIQKRWQLIRGDSIQVGNMDITIMAV